MRLIPRLLFVALLTSAVSPAIAQVNPAATKPSTVSVPLVVGVGFSNFAMDWGPGRRMNAVSAWVDLYPLPGAMKDLGIEVEGRDLNYLHPVANLREDTGQLGAIYNISHFRNVHPYGKFLAGVGSMDFPGWPNMPYYHHDTYLVRTMGAGTDIRAYEHLWIRTEYQYQFWRNVLGPRTSNPNGFTIGAQWDFRKSDKAVKLY